MKKQLSRLRAAALAFGFLAFALLAGHNAVWAAGDDSNCTACAAAGSSLAVDPASYRVWPSGARTLLDVHWSPNGSTASLKLINEGTSSAPAFSINVLVDYHDPAAQTSVSSTWHLYSVPALTPQTSTTLDVPLDFAQCDVFITVKLGSASSLVFRTGNPAAC